MNERSLLDEIDDLLGTDDLGGTDDTGDLGGCGDTIMLGYLSIGGLLYMVQYCNDCHNVSVLIGEMAEDGSVKEIVGFERCEVIDGASAGRDGTVFFGFEVGDYDHTFGPIQLPFGVDLSHLFQEDDENAVSS